MNKIGKLKTYVPISRQKVCVHQRLYDRPPVEADARLLNPLPCMGGEARVFTTGDFRVVVADFFALVELTRLVRGAGSGEGEVDGEGSFRLRFVTEVILVNTIVSLTTIGDTIPLRFFSCGSSTSISSSLSKASAP